MALDPIYLDAFNEALKILNVSDNASKDEIENAYSSLSSTHGLPSDGLDHVKKARDLLIKNIHQTEYAEDYAYMFLILNDENIKKAQRAEAQKTLGVSENSTGDEIEQAYKKLAMQWHPDKWSTGTTKEKTTANDLFQKN